MTKQRRGEERRKGERRKGEVWRGEGRCGGKGQERQGVATQSKAR
jgi:hypothetical protein